MIKDSPFELTPVPSTSPVAPYLGGKRNLARRLCAIIRAIPHSGYYEPFVGMGGVFLRRDFRAAAEAINDISGDVVTLFRILQRHHQSFLEELKWSLSSRAEFERLMRVDPTTLTDIERAARFLYLQRTTFGGKVEQRSFGVSARNAARFDLTKLVPLLADVHERLAGVTIERLPYADFIRRYDHPGALFYLDPPYFAGEADYGTGVFERADFERLADQLTGLSGRFVLSINDTPEMRAAFERFSFDAVGTTYTIGTASAGSGQRAGELIVQSSS